ncbi:MAG: CapA family protein, partial [bacterium]
AGTEHAAAGTEHASGGFGLTGQARHAPDNGTAGGGRPSVFGLGLADSGIPSEWVCSNFEAGVYRIAKADLSTVESEASRVGRAVASGDRAVCSIHWGGNWGYRIPGAHRRLARAMIDSGASIVHGHSSHHVKGFEIYRGRLILYGCGDFVSDYEGIPGKEAYRPDLSLMFFADIDDHGGMRALQIVPLRKVRFSLRRADREDATWLASVLKRESSGFQGDVAVRADGTLVCEPGLA